MTSIINLGLAAISLSLYFDHVRGVVLEPETEGSTRGFFIDCGCGQLTQGCMQGVESGGNPDMTAAAGHFCGDYTGVYAQVSIQMERNRRLDIRNLLVSGLSLVIIARLHPDGGKKMSVFLSEKMSENKRNLSVSCF